MMCISRSYARAAFPFFSLQNENTYSPIYPPLWATIRKMTNRMQVLSDKMLETIQKERCHGFCRKEVFRVEGAIQIPFQQPISLCLLAHFGWFIWKWPTTYWCLRQEMWRGKKPRKLHTTVLVLVSVCSVQEVPMSESFTRLWIQIITLLEHNRTHRDK